jgi:dTDP-4-amino-4,6-dideoxygalactose transaminase
VVGLRLLKEARGITDRRIANAARYDDAFNSLAPKVRVPLRRAGVKHVFHLYVIRAERRDQLLEHLRSHEIDARVHYPVPVHLQAPGRALGYGPGDFPQSEADCQQIITLPVHQHLTDEEIAYTIDQVRGFYG